VSLPAGQPRYWVEGRRTPDNMSGVWHRAKTIEKARSIREFLLEAGNECVIIYEWVGLKYAAVEGIERGVKTMAPPFWESGPEED